MGVGLTVTLISSLMQGFLCMNFNVSLPRRVGAISGSCLRVPCRFQLPKAYDADLLNCSHSGVWNKGRPTGRTMFSSGQSRGQNTIQGELTGDLKRKNCTTVFSSFPERYNDTYFFRLECPNRLKYSFDTGVYIDSQSEPPPPQLSGGGGVSEGERVMLQCSAPVSCHVLPPCLTWRSPPTGRTEETVQTKESEDGSISLTSTLTFTASASHHNQTVTCSVSYPLTAGGSTEPAAATHTLSVQYAPRSTTAALSPSGPVPEGRGVTLTCSSDANPPAQRFTWYRDRSGQLSRRAEGGELLLLASRQDSGVYLCEAQNQRGSQRSRAVVLEVDFTAVPYIICGVVAVLFVLTVTLYVIKYQSLSRRLKLIELKLMGEHTYAALRVSSVTADYDQLQFKSRPPVDASRNENPIAMGTRN
ncbi:B-cell receptor CD22 [Centroberyx affinis]|uniref:B-cell receptor CD22 n=1 Tax=Centroberyx affinis TaxID=166261 RepID=UPI003A5BF718